jgi:hypothetical protein
MRPINKERGGGGAWRLMAAIQILNTATNYQPKVGIHSGEDIGEDARPWWNCDSGIIPSIGTANQATRSSGVTDDER